MSEQLRKGYKQTEIGVIPEDWEVKTIGDSARVVSGGTPSTNIARYWNGNINWFTPTEIGIDKYVYESKRKISNEGLENSSARILPIDTIILTTRAGIGDLSILKIEACTNQGFQSLISNSNTDNEYLYYLLSTLKKEFLKNASGSTFLEISPNKLKSILIPLPTHKEQTAIANALSDTDAWISSLEQLLTKKRLIKQGAMQELLQPKEGWELKKLGEILNYIQPTPYLVTDTEYSNDFSIPVLTAGKTFLLGYTSEEFGIFDDLPTIIFDDFTTAIQFVDFPFKAKSSAMKMLVLKDKSNNLKLMFEIIKNIKYPLGDHKRHWIGEYSKIEIKLPKPEEQTRIATILSDMDEELAQLETKLAKAKQIKQGMMQELLTGKTRLL